MRAGARIVVIGSVNADLVVRVKRFPAPGETVFGSDFKVYAGGKGANQAYAAARLGASVAFVGRVGRDAHARTLRSSLEAAGVDLEYLADDDRAPTGVGIIGIDGAGQNQIVVVSGANSHVSVADVERARGLLVEGAIVLLQAEIPLETVAHAAREARRAGATVILDPAPAHRDVLGLVPLADIVTPNEGELATLVGASPAGDLDASREQARSLLRLGARRVIAKLGSRGARLVAVDEERHWPAPPVRALDTTAAGDVWNGAFASALAEGLTEDAAGRRATDAAAFSVTRPGAQPSMPSRAELHAWANRGGSSQAG